MPWQIAVNSDCTEVQLDLSQFDSADEIDFDAVINALNENKVQITSTVEETVAEVTDRLATFIACDDQPPPQSLLLAQATPAVDGTNGHFDWTEKCDPDRKPCVQLPDTDTHSRASFYEQTSLILVKAGDQIGTLHPPTQGQPGTDVLGRPITAKDGSEHQIQLGPNVEFQTPGQTLVALVNGEVKDERGQISVDPVLRLKSHVDFATGNINYDGDIDIGGNIKDLFQVKATGNITVAGIIEGARIECGGNLEVKRGIAGKEKGHITVTGNVSAKYLSNVAVWTKGDAHIASEIVNGDLNCSGSVMVKTGAIHGGQVTAAGTIESPVIGSPAGVRTVIRAGIDPFVDLKIRQLEQEAAQCNDTIASLMPRATALLKSNPGHPCPILKKIAGQIKQNKQRLDEIERLLDQLYQQFEQTSPATIIVRKTIYSGVVLSVGLVTDTIFEQINGPMEIFPEKSPDMMPVLAFRTPAEAAK